MSAATLAVTTAGIAAVVTGRVIGSTAGEKKQWLGGCGAGRDEGLRGRDVDRGVSGCGGGERNSGRRGKAEVPEIHF